MNPAWSVRIDRGLRFASLSLLLVAFLFLLFIPLRALSLPFTLAGSAKTSSKYHVPQVETLNRLKSFEVLASDFSSHALFYNQSQSVLPQGPGLTEQMKNFQLVGIVQGEKPEALIQHRSTQQTYFVRTGESFDAFKVKAINTGTIEVEFEGQTMEMQLEGGVQ